MTASHDTHLIDRRKALGLMAGATSTLAAGALFPATPTPYAGASTGRRTFKLKYAPHLGMFKEHAGEDPIDQLQFMADQGFTAFEDNNLMKRPVELQERIGRTLASLGMTMGVFVIDAGDNWRVSYATGQPEFRERFLQECNTAVDVARRVNARWMTVLPGYFERRLPIGLQTGHVIDTLRAGADVLAKHGLVMVLEPLSDNPDLLLRTSDQAYALCRAVNSPACKILYDMYHIQRNQGQLIPHLDLAWEEIAYFQIGDVPGRKEPGTGEINYRNIFRHIHQKMRASGRDFVFGMEHGNQRPGREGEQAVIDAYVLADSF